jgi:hypothetical protein
MRREITIHQRANEHSSHVFVRAGRLVRVGQILRIVHASGGGGHATPLTWYAPRGE